jgi:serine/threonine-protein kinase
MVSEDGVVKVLDFGLARPTAPLSFRTQAGHVLGTPKYMAPEQLAGAEVDARTDQYSFGLTAYELLAGAHPGGAIAGLIQPPLLDTAAPGISRALALVIARAMATAPEERYASMEDVVVALEDAAAGRRPREDCEPSAAVERDELTLASPGASAERVASTVRFGSPAAGAPATLLPDTAASPTGGAPGTRQPPDTAATPTASSPPPANAGLNATVPLGAAATLDAAALQRTAESAPPTLEAAARPLQKTAPLAMDGASVEQARAQVWAASAPVTKTLLTAGEVPPPPKTAPVLGRPGESASLIAAPRPKAASPSVPPVRGDASPSPTRPPSSTRRSSSNGIRVAMVVVAIVVLGLCAFAGAYYGSRAFAVRPAATPPPATTGALAAPPGTTSPAAATHAASAPHAATEIAAPSGPAPAASPRPAPTPTPTPTPRPAPTPAPATTTTRPAASNLDARF